MDDYEDMKYYIDDQIRDGLDKMYDKLTDEMFGLIQQQMKEVTGEILTGEDAARLLGVTTRTLYNWDRDGVLPRYRIGGKFYWKYDDVLSVLEDQNRKDE